MFVTFCREGTGEEADYITLYEGDMAQVPARGDTVVLGAKPEWEFRVERVDWVLEPAKPETYRDKREEQYQWANVVLSRRPKR